MALSDYDHKYNTAPRVFKGQWHRWCFVQFATFNRFNDERNVNVNCNDNDWNDNWWFAGVRNSLYFSPNNYCLGEFCFVSCPFQPPSILPITFIFSDSEIYFLLSSDFVSQSTIKSIFIVSILRIARRTYGAFSSFVRKLAMEMASIASIKSVSIFCPSVYLWILGSFW